MHELKDKLNGFVLFKGAEIKPIETEQWILGFPRGTYYISKYDSEFTFDDTFFNQIAKAFDSESLSKPIIDKDHNFTDSFGDITSYKIDDIGMHFLVKPTSDGIYLIKERKYKYISPAWGKTIDNNKMVWENRLSAISLVNFPAFEGSLPELQTQLQLNKFAVVSAKKQKEDNMEITMLAKSLGLREDVNIDSINTAIKEIQNINLGYQKENTELKASLKKAEDTTIELSKEIQKINTEKVAKEAEEITQKWVELGKLHPAIKDMVIARYMKDKDNTIKEFESIPEKFHASEDKQKSGTNHEGKNLVEDKDVKKMLSRGLNPEDKTDVEIYMSGKSRRKEA